MLTDDMFTDILIRGYDPRCMRKKSATIWGRYKWDERRYACNRLASLQRSCPNYKFFICEEVNA